MSSNTSTTNCANISYTNGTTNCTTSGGANCVNPTGTNATKCVCATGFTAQTDGTCKSSSASPLAIAIICALIVSIIASIAVAAIVIRRKVSNARAADAIVSDAFQ